MPTTRRKVLTKSRRGCVVCKQRRVKCDEETFPCLNCTRRSLPCAYLSPSRFAALSLATGISKQDASASSTPPPPPAPAPTQLTEQPPPNGHHPEPGLPVSGLSRVEEIALMHFYTTATSPTLAQDKGDELVWRDVVPLDSFSNEFVLDAVFALAALHKACVQPASASRYASASSFYQHRGLREFAQQMSKLKGSASHAFFAFSMMVTVHTIAISNGAPGLDPVSPFETLSSVYELLGGTGHLAQGILHPHSSSRYRDLIKSQQYSAVLSDSTTTLPGDVVDALRNLRRHVARMVSPNRDDRSHPYHHTIDSLEVAFKISVQCQDSAIGSIVSWPVQLDEQCFALYRRADPLMLLIFIHYGVLYLSLNSRWWAKGFGSRIVRTLSEYLHEADMAWSQSTAWALAKAALTFP